MNYEYKELRPLIEPKDKTLVSQFNHLGRYGWRFIFKDGFVYYFMREKKK